MSGYKNRRAVAFLASIPAASIDDDRDDLTMRCKFNFSYFQKQDAGQDFSEWNHDQLKKLLLKLAEYSKKPLSHWTQQRAGKAGSVLAIYGDFPKSSDFTHPKHVPHQARWARFRLEQAVRLIGFIVPESYHGKPHQKTKQCFDCNTFYVVFLDINHRFYITENQ